MHPLLQLSPGQRHLLWRLVLLCLLVTSGCDTARQVASSVGLPSSGPPSAEEVGRGLREALAVGTSSATNQLGSPGGYLRNQLVRIALPPEARQAADFVRQNGGQLGNQVVDDLIERLNRAAEQAAANPRTREIFLQAIQGMTIQDAWNILRGDSTAATRYLQSRTEDQLTQLFAPVIAQELDRAGVAPAWNQFASTYNRLGLVLRQRQPLPSNISQYATQQALAGVFRAVGQEEARIRQNPAARVTDLLKRVFSYQ